MHWLADLMAAIGVALNGIPQGIMAMGLGFAVFPTTFSFVLLGDDELSYAAAKELLSKLPKDFDYLVTMESKGIPLTHDLGLLTNHPHSIVLRKSIKGYMQHPVTTSVNSITTKHQQELVLNGDDE